jgi:hypothetical protein
VIRATTGLLKNDNKGMLCKLGCTGKVDIGEAAWCLGCNAANKKLSSMMLFGFLDVLQP